MNASNGAASGASLATITTRAVDQIGDSAASELERLADGIEAEAQEKAANLLRFAKENADVLRRFAASWRTQTRAAAEDMTRFCAKSTDIFTSIEALEARVAQSHTANVEVAKSLATPLDTSTAVICGSHDNEHR
jgi:hypothetical protein